MEDKNEMMSKLRRLPALLLLLALLPLWAAGDGAELLKNGDFAEVGADGLPASWKTDAWISAEGYTLYSVQEEADGSHAACVNNIGLNDARFSQQVAVQPDSLYRLSGDIRADGIEDQGWGANLSVAGVYALSESFFDTEGQWMHVECYGETGPDQHEITVFARVGGYSGESVGRAWFRNLSLVEVDELPEEVVADLWFVPYSYAAAMPEDSPEAEPAAPFWPWLLAIAVGWGLLVLLAAPLLMRDRRELTEESRWPGAVLWAGLGAAFLLRMLIAGLVEGYSVDVGCFTGWAQRLNSVGLPGFYNEAEVFCDYPPGYLYILGLNGLISRLLGGGTVLRVGMLAFLNTLLPNLCDLMIALAIYFTARHRRMDRQQASVLGLLMAFNPATIVISAAWKQIDAVLALLLVGVAVCAIRRRWILALPLYVLAVLVKPQALMLGFLGLAAMVLDLRRHPLDIVEMGIGAAIAVLSGLILVLPFALGQEDPLWLINLYGKTLSSYPYVTVNAANLYYLFGENWSPLAEAAQWGPCVTLALTAAGWGLFAGLKNSGRRFSLPRLSREKEPVQEAAPALLPARPRWLWWAESALMLPFAVFFLLAPALGLGWEAVGWTATAMALLIVMGLCLRGGELSQLPLLGGTLFVLLFALGTKMHERYIYPALALLALAFALRRSRRTLLALALLSAALCLNAGIPLDNSIRLGASMGHLNTDTDLLAKLVSLLNLMCVPLTLWTCADVCLQAAPVRLTSKPGPLRGPLAGRPVSALDFHPDSSLHWKGLDTALILLITAVYAAVGLAHLGSHKAPQTAWTSTNARENLVLDLGQHYDDFSMAYYCRVSYSPFSVAVSDDGENWSEEYWAEMSEGECFRWKYLTPCYDSGSGRSWVDARRYQDTQKLSGRYVRITAQQINLALCEVIFRTSVYEPQTWTETDVTTGKRVTRTEQVQVSGASIRAKLRQQAEMLQDSSLASDGRAVCDEPDSLEGDPNWYNSTYFDEIYHARTAWEHAHGAHTYETTHPPLGKVIMSWMVSLFGMTPFVWRLAGCVMGILMVPLMYLLGKQLTKRTELAALAAALMALDCMHFTQTRIATIDSFPVLFILFSYFFMLRFMQRDLTQERWPRLLWPLALSGFGMGCAIASKWIGIYAGAGLAVLYFWTLLRHLRLRRESRRLLQEAELDEDTRAVLQRRVTLYPKRAVLLCLSCVGFFIAVPLIIYLLSYIPHLRWQRPESLGEFLRMVMDGQRYMFEYHAEPGRGMDHPFYSPWWEWPVMERPMYYAMAYYVPRGYSMAIFCFGNPVIWFPALAALAWVAVRWAGRHFWTGGGSDAIVHAHSGTWSVNRAFVLIGMLAQFLPWLLVPRGTYIYHYFASVPFLMLCTVLAFHDLYRRWPKAARIALIVYTALCLAGFILCYPYASGMVTPTGWLDLVKQLIHVYYN